MSKEGPPPRRLEDLPLMLSPAEVQAVARVGRRQCYELIRSGRLGAVKIGRVWRVPRQRLLAFLGLDEIPDTSPKHRNEPSTTTNTPKE